jgi:RHS repeat-associated protein
MARDTLVINTEGLFLPSTNPSANQAISSIVQTFINAFVAVPGAALNEAGTAATTGGGSTDLANAALSLQQSNTDDRVPAAFLNFILYDENMNIIPEGSGAIQINQASANTWQNFPTQTVNIPQNGFMRVFTSNTSGVDVRFDNLSVVLYKGQLQEEYNYYPYGLAFDQHQVFSGLSSTNYLYNGKELQQNEFGANNGLEFYDYGARMYDAQIGRWTQVDPMSNMMRRHSPYNFAFDNPMRFVDADGMAPEDPSGGGGGGDDKNKPIAPQKPEAKSTTSIPGPVIPNLAPGFKPADVVDNRSGGLSIQNFVYGGSSANPNGVHDDNVISILTTIILTIKADANDVSGLNDDNPDTYKEGKAENDGSAPEHRLTKDDDGTNGNGQFYKDTHPGREGKSTQQPSAGNSQSYIGRNTNLDTIGIFLSDPNYNNLPDQPTATWRETAKLFLKPKKP